ncbi:hypothetical protein ACFE04_002305 [Oxalis oulophora]
MRIRRILNTITLYCSSRLNNIQNEQRQLGVCLYNYSTSSSTSTSTSVAIAKARQSKASKALHDLYRRISQLGDQTVSIVPILDQHTVQILSVKKHKLIGIIKELRYYRRYNHALQLSKWMTEKRLFFNLTAGDVAIQLDLISKAHGIEEAEKYFNNLPSQQKVLEVYSAFLNCYVNSKSVEKAEAIFREMSDLGLATQLSYNTLLNLYKKTGKYENLDNLLYEMGANKISFDKYTYLICMNAYAANFDIDQMERTLKQMVCDTKVTPDCGTYACVANLYTKLGLADKALVMLKKGEGLVTDHKRNAAYDFLLEEYAATGRKDEVFRIWETYKKENVSNKGYMSMITSLLKLDDIEGAEKIFEEWESQNRNYDIWIPKLLIEAYTRRKGESFLEKAENLLNRVRENRVMPDAATWYYMANGYLLNNETMKAVEAMKEAMIAAKICRHGWRPRAEIFATCLDFLKKKGDIKGAENFTRLMGEINMVSVDIKQKVHETCWSLNEEKKWSGNSHQPLDDHWKSLNTTGRLSEVFGEREVTGNRSNPVTKHNAHSSSSLTLIIKNPPPHYTTPHHKAPKIMEISKEDPKTQIPHPLSDDDELPSLSSHTLAALKEFLAEQNQTNPSTEDEEEEEKKPSLLSEDWRLSQFWYEPNTAHTLVEEVQLLCGGFSLSNVRVACIACPTLYVYIKGLDVVLCEIVNVSFPLLIVAIHKHSAVNVQLLEYDKRFGQYGSDFTYYDYNEPEVLPENMKHAFQVIIADPPYLSKECLEKVTRTVSFLAQPQDSHLLLLTGAVQTDRAKELLGLRPCGFRPQHSSKLGNEFRLFTNYDPGSRLGGWEQDE